VLFRTVRAVVTQSAVVSSLADKCFNAFLLLYIVLIDVLIYSAAHHARVFVASKKSAISRVVSGRVAAVGSAHKTASEPKHNMTCCSLTFKTTAASRKTVICLLLLTHAYF